MGKPKTVSDLIGDWGKWQTNVFLFCLANYVLQAYNSLSFYYFAPQLDFWCGEPFVRVNNLTSDSDKCSFYANCKQWIFENTYQSNIVNEWNLICQQSWLASTTQSVFMFGYIASGLILALSADRIGRIPTIWYSFCFELFANLLIIFSSSIWQFMIARFIMGIGVCTRGNVLFALFFESCGKKYRGDAGLLLTGGWIIGIMILTGFAYFVRSFRFIQMFALAVLLLLMLWAIFIDESVRWQFTHNQEEAAAKTLTKAIKMNKKHSIMEEDYLKKQIHELSEAMQEEIECKSNLPKASFLDLFKTAKIRLYVLIFWISMPVNALIYYGISFGIGGVGGASLYVSQILAGLVEIPGLFLSLYFLHNHGRVRFTAINSILTGIACLTALIFISNATITFIMMIAAKFFITNSYNVNIVQGSEIFPTILRTAAGGSITILSRIGASLAPFVKERIQAGQLAWVFVVFTILSVLSGILTSYLPETRGKDIPDTIDDTENLNDLPDTTADRESLK